MVFLSKNPEEHHQLVLNPRQALKSIESPVDHISFRVGALSSLRAFYRVLKASPAVIQTVSHGTTWSIYFRDPEENRLELFTDTPWHVNQPCRFEIDLGMSDEELLKFTEHRLNTLPGFDKVKNWKQMHANRISREI